MARALAMARVTSSGPTGRVPLIPTTPRLLIDDTWLPARLTNARPIS